MTKQNTEQLQPNLPTAGWIDQMNADFDLSWLLET